MSDFDARIASLTVSQRALLARRLDAATPRRDLPERGVALVAYAVSVDSRRPSSDALRHYLGERLPDYMVPSSFVFLDELPVTSAGKIDKQKLPDADALASTGDTVARPRTPAEEALAQIWAEVLGFDEVGLNDNFFEMGGDSLTSIRILARSRQLGFEVTPKQFFAHPTVAGIAAVATRSVLPVPSPRAERPRVEDAGGRTPSDFPLADVDQEDLDRISDLLREEPE